jgi:ribose 5-phosphate isomerase B
MCGTGLGMSYAANRHAHVRAAVAWSPEIAELARRHNDANVLVLPARFVGADEAERILDAWLATPFEGGRHERRIEKIESTAAAPRAAAQHASAVTAAAAEPGRDQA